MSLPEEPKHDEDLQRLKMPPFVVGTWAALAYVQGTYNPPGRKATEGNADDFLGIYLSKEDPGVGLISVSGAGKYVAFHRCGEADATAELAAIDAFINYEIPFHQWRLYPTGMSEADTLCQMTLREDYDKALKGLSRVLYLARFFIGPGRPKLTSMFLLAPRTSEAIMEDELTADAVRRCLLGEEKAARYLKNREKLRQRASQRVAEIDDGNSNA